MSEDKKLTEEAEKYLGDLIDAWGEIPLSIAHFFMIKANAEKIDIHMITKAIKLTDNMCLL